jgi:glycosyltransferase involved in cell wall biosynthesis
MQAQGHEVILEPNTDQFIEQHIQWADVVVLEMVWSWKMIRLCRKYKKKIIFECDDLIHTVPKTHYSYKETHGIKNQVFWWSRIIGTFIFCDGFISTNKELNKIYGRFAKKRLIFPNYCDLPHWLKEHKPNTNKQEVRILWAGSVSHNGDLMAFKPVMKKVLEKYPNVKFIYVGTGGIRTDDLQAKFIYGDDLWEGLPNNREGIVAIPPNVWTYKLAALQADLAIAPLEKNEFNRYKSQCKYLEYGINHIPAVYSSWFFSDVVHKHTGMLADTPDDWFTAICYLVEHPEERKRMGENAFQDVLNNHNVNDHLKEWEDFVVDVANS